jgi:hypothetical protein
VGRYDVFDAADAPLWTIPDLQTLAPEAFATLTLRLTPGHRRVAVNHAVEEIWRALHKQQPGGDAPPRAGSLLVWRQETIVYHRRLDAPEAALLDQLAAGTSFGAICEQIAGRASDPAAVALNLLARWTSDGLLVRNLPLTLP